MADAKVPRANGNRRQTGQQVEYAERRESERVPLSLAAELIELQAGSRITGRMTDSGKTGCYIDSLNCFPAQTLLRIQVFKGKEVFEGDARVVYAHPGLGMGILFTDISPEQRDRLQKWMSEESVQAELVRNRPGHSGEKKPPLSPEERFDGLLQLLVDKNVITAAEARKLQAEITL